jgi:N6-L-threonylcarbamoyladenine synthase
MLLLALDSSCDETSAALVRDGRQVLANVVASQVTDHAPYGGVVPEIASRRHLESIVPVINRALDEAHLALDDVEGIAVTRGPGLVGALLVAVSTAKAIAYARRLPLVGLHHIEGHLLAKFLEQEVEFPFVALVVSGGHTHLYRVDGIGRYTILGQTLDDAAGEAFDKGAKLMGLSYPGGALIDTLASKGDPAAVTLPRPLLHDGTLNFSFSGLKTALLTRIRRYPPVGEQELADLCASYQAAICEVLVRKSDEALRRSSIKRLVVSGGVACNSGLRREMTAMALQQGVELLIPAPILCTDNAAMMAVAGDFYLRRGMASDRSLDAVATWSLTDAALLLGGVR